MTQTIISGVGSRKVYGKLGRRIRAKARLEADLANSEMLLKSTITDLNVQEKEPSKYKEHIYKRLLNTGAYLSDRQIPRIKKEIETLKSHI